jgi:hypothetical protein
VRHSLEAGLEALHWKKGVGEECVCNVLSPSGPEII